MSDVIEEDLSIAQLPVTEADHEERSKLQNIKGTIVQRVVQQWRLLVEISKLRFLHDILVEHGKTSDWKKHR